MQTTITPAPITATEIRQALGLRHFPAVDAELGEGDADVRVWSMYELDGLFRLVDGHVSAQIVTRTLADGERVDVIEVSVHIELPSLDTVARVFTDWVPSEEAFGYGLPVVRALGPLPILAQV